MKTAILLFVFSASLAGADGPRTNDTANSANVATLKQLFLGSSVAKPPMVKLAGKTPAGEDCSVEVFGSAFGVVFSVHETTASGHTARFRVSRSAKTSSKFQMKAAADSIQASQISLFMDEQSSGATTETMDINFAHDKTDGKAEIRSMRVTNTTTSVVDVSCQIK